MFVNHNIGLISAFETSSNSLLCTNYISRIQPSQIYMTLPNCGLILAIRTSSLNSFCGGQISNAFCQEWKIVKSICGNDMIFALVIIFWMWYIWKKSSGINTLCQAVEIVLDINQKGTWLSLKRINVSCSVLMLEINAEQCVDIIAF